jgi:phosphonate transport system permease protein
MWGAGFFVFEYNVRSASVLGVVGAGGIGAELIYLLEWRRLPEFFIGLLLVVATVMLLDAASRRLRKNLAARRGS